jgi:AraC-like DNA-binding protein
VVRTRGRSSGGTISALEAAAVAVGLQAAGADVEAVFARAGIPLAEVGDPERRFPRERIILLWEKACEAVDDPAFGLHIAERVPYGAFGVLEYIARSSATLGEALARVARYVRLLEDAAEVALLRQGYEVTVVPGLGGGWFIQSDVMECLLAMTLRLLRELSGDAGLLPRAVEFRHAAPADTREHTRVFGVDVRFGTERDGITFAAAQLELPVVQADPRLAAILDRHAQELLARLPPAGSLVQRVRAALAAELRGGNPSLEQIASKLGMGTRTVRRHLQEEGTSLSLLLDELRRELAIRYLEEHTMTLEAIAFDLGFADARAFRRAFKRWTGRTPREGKTA